MSKKVKLIDNILDHTDDGVIVIGMDGVIQSTNNEALKILGYSEIDLVGRHYESVFTDNESHQSFIKFIADGLQKEIEYHLEEITFVKPNGQSANLKVSTSLLSGKDAIARFARKKSLVIFIKPAREKSAITSYNEEIVRLQEEVKRLKERNKELQKLFSRFDLLRISIAGIIFLVFLAIINYSKSSVQIFPKQIIPNVKQVKQERIVQARLDTLMKEIQLSGIIEPFNKVVIAAQTSGKVVKRNFAEGDYVAKGTILYQMDTKELAKNVRSARVKYMSLLEEYNKLKNWETSLEVMQAKRSFEIAKISLNNERKKLSETKKLFEKGIIPRVEYDQALTAYKKAQYDYENAKQTLESKMDKGSPEKLEMLQLKLSNAKQELDEIEARYEATLIRAPVSGIVMLPVSSNGQLGSFKNEGDMVNDGDLVAAIGATDSYTINSSIGELSVKYVKENQNVLVTGPAFKNVMLQGRVDWVPENAVLKGGFRYYPVRISITDVPDSVRKEIRLGMYAQAFIQVQRLEGVVTVPIEAIYENNGQDVVYVRTEEDHFESRPVQVGYTDLTRIVIKDGLEPGEEVVIGDVSGS